MNQKILSFSIKIQNAVLPLNIQSGLETAKTSVMGDVKYIVNEWAVPLILVGIGVAILFNIAKLSSHRKQGEDYQDHIKILIICVVCATAVASFPLWGWQMLGVSKDL